VFPEIASRFKTLVERISSALAGLDRMAPRRLLGVPGFEYVIDAGLGATATEYRKVRLNVFDSTLDPAQYFEGVEDDTDSRVAELM